MQATQCAATAKNFAILRKMSSCERNCSCQAVRGYCNLRPDQTREEVRANSGEQRHVISNPFFIMNLAGHTVADSSTALFLQRWVACSLRPLMIEPMFPALSLSRPLPRARHRDADDYLPSPD